MLDIKLDMLLMPLFIMIGVQLKLKLEEHIIMVKVEQNCITNTPINGSSYF